MKAIAALAAVIALVAVPVAVQNAHAQVELSLGGGVNSPLGDFGDQVNTGYMITAGIGYRFMPLIAIGGEFSFNGNKATDELLSSLGPEYEASTHILQYAGMLKLLLPVANHNVFVKGLMGSYDASIKVSGPLGEASVSDSKLGYGIGGGLVINGASGTSLFLDTTYHHIPFDDGATNFLTISAGGIFHFNLFE